MPHDDNKSGADFGTVDYQYDYPGDLEMRPGTELHGNIRDRILSRASESYLQIQKKFKSWDKIDNTLRVHIRQSALEKDIKAADERVPTPIVVPISTAMLETILTQFVSTFLNDPIFRVEGVGSEDVMKGLLMEQVLKIMTIKNKVALGLHTMFKDYIAYGMGVVVTTWHTQMGYKTKVVTPEKKVWGWLGSSIRKGKPYRKTKRTILWEGVALQNINPRQFLPDPSVAIQDVQKAEYVGYLDYDNLMSLRVAEDAGEEGLFNIKYLDHVRDLRSRFVKGYMNTDIYNSREDFSVPNALNANSAGQDNLNPVDLVNMYILLTPSEWELGDSDVPEKWLFTLANDEVIIRAQPLGHHHDQYPFAVCAPGFDGYSTHFPSPIELIDGLQLTINALFNLQITSQRRALNDSLVVDPTRVDIESLRKPGPGKLIFLKNTLLGGDPKDAVFQLNYRDMTAQNITDSLYILDMAQRTTGATDILQGSPRQSSERRTATEVQGTFNAAISRLTKDARIISLMAMTDIGNQFVSMTQQLMKESVYIKVAGSLEEKLKQDFQVEATNGRVEVSPMDLIGEYDLLLHDGTSPNPSHANTWLQMFQIMANNPLLSQQFNLVQVFKHVARMLGAKNIDDFIAKSGPPQVVPDEEVERELQRGNIQPIGGRIGGNGGIEGDVGLGGAF